MSNIDDLSEAFANLPPDAKAKIQQLTGAEFQQEEIPIDSVAIKMELIKFVTELHKHNQGVDWETNKIKPSKIGFKQIMQDAQDLFEFITE